MRDIHDMGAVGSSSSRGGGVREQFGRNYGESRLLLRLKFRHGRLLKMGYRQELIEITGIWTRGACVNYVARGSTTAFMQSLPAHMQELCAMN
jgi:hypothetical protein